MSDTLTTPYRPWNHTTVYRAYDRAGSLLYVGCTDAFITRYKDHRRRSAWFADVHSWVLTDYPRWWLAREAEAQAIRAEDPIHNVQLNPRCRTTGGRGVAPYRRRLTEAVA